MVPTLLWRCPLCQTHDALVQKPRWFRPDLVRCTACGTIWELIRIVGGRDYRMRIVQGREVGLERPLAEWYDLVKADLTLEAIVDPSLDLEPGEALYLKSKAVELVALRDDPLFEGFFVRKGKPSLTSHAHPPMLERLGVGMLLLTDQRLILRIRGKFYSLWLKSLGAVWLERDRFLVVRVGEQFYLFRFLEESLLKWLTYLKRAIKPVEERYRLRIPMACD